jgi:hypothetical protein
VAAEHRRDRAVLARAAPAPGPRWRQATWWVGLALCYVAMQSRWDYFSEHAFFLRRLQHLVLHHRGAAGAGCAPACQCASAGRTVNGTG